MLALWLVGITAAWSEINPRSVRAIAPSFDLASKVGAPRAKAAQRTPADLVVVVSIDGLRPDVITPSMKALHRLYLQGSSAKNARTIDKSATLPSHASMVSGVDSSEHGLEFNAYKPDRGTIARPTMFSVAHSAGLPTYMFVGKAKLKHLLGKPSDAELKVAGFKCGKLVKESIPQLQKQKKGLLFMHFADPDSAGHRYGWMSNQYVEAAHAADECLDEVMNAIEHGGNMDRTLLLVTADHGGHNRSHGTRMEVDAKIPWFAWGGPAKKGRTKRDVSTMDTAATALSALGLKLPDHIQGAPVSEAIGGLAAGPAGMPLVGNAVEAP
jgi:predicted AlkP superfamily pyrophosphatase or phosphodiesterase